MIEDLNALKRAELDADVCLVGAGAAGITMARALSGTGLRVCLVESGGFGEEPETQSLYEGASIGHPMAMVEGRYRVFGGTTTRWTGRCAELDPIDFEPRPWLGLSGWPFTHAALAPYYKRAGVVCAFADAAPEPLGVPAFNRDEVAPFAWRYATQGDRLYLDWGKHNRDALERADDVRVLLHANLATIETENDEAQVSGIVVRSLSGASMKIRARAFVLCCGGIENARLLLANPIGAPGAAGNRHDQIGRYFMQHPRGRTAVLDADPAAARRVQDLFNIFAPRSRNQHELGFALSPEVQRREGLLNSSAILNYDADPESGWESAKAAIRDVAGRRVSGETIGRVGRALGGAHEVAVNAMRFASKRNAVVSTRAIELVIDLEQAPNPESRVTLGSERDALGMPRAHVDWRLSELERTTARRFTELLAKEFARLGLGKLVPDRWLTSNTSIGPGDFYGTYHHIGTTRMSADACTGVVDGDCRVHGVSNLYAAGASVFASGGQANPTFTIVALALRLADHLNSVLTVV